MPTRTYYQKHKDAVKAYQRNWYRTHKQAQRNSWLKKKYGITVETFDRMVAKQKGACGICGARFPLVVDHDHRTGGIRGLLCSTCNSRLGHFENLAWREAALAYLSANS